MDLLHASLLSVGLNSILLLGHQNVLKVFNKRTTAHKDLLDNSWFNGWFLLSRSSPYLHNILWALMIAFQVPFFVYIFKHYQGVEDESESGEMVGVLTRRCIQFFIGYIASTALWQYCYSTFFQRYFNLYNSENPRDLVEATGTALVLIRLVSVLFSFVVLTFGVILYSFVVVDVANVIGHDKLWSMHVWFCFFAIYYVSISTVDLTIVMGSPEHSNQAATYELSDVKSTGKRYEKLAV